MEILLQFIPLLAMLSIVGFAVWWSKRKVRLADEKGLDYQPSGFRGWLIVLALIQMLILVGSLLEIRSEVTRIAAGAFDQNALITAVRLAVVGAGFCLALVGCYLMASRRRAYATVFIATVVFRVAAGIVLDILAVVTHEIEPWEIGSVSAGHGIVGGVIGGALWIAYVLRSRRVKNTFVR